MLARKSKLFFNGLEVGTTPMLVPSISSRINLKYEETMKTIGAIVDGPFLVSAYDFYQSDKKVSITFPDLIFLDSGGYECNKDQDVSDSGLYNPKQKPWDRKLHLQTINKWKNKIPTVLISYDHPSERYPIIKQIELAKDLFKRRKRFLKEILLKTESKESIRIKVEKVIENLDQLKSFDIIGFTDKELGNTVFKRMQNIAKIRKAMDEKGMTNKIHIFGSLDTITTPLYFISGADIFDGLSWLRHVYHKGNTLYLDSYGPMLYGADEDQRRIWIQVVYSNYRYLRNLKDIMERFVTSGGEFNIFENNSKFYEKNYINLTEKIGGD